MKKGVLLGLFILVILPFSVFADSQLENGGVQLSVGSFLLDILDTNANIDQIDFNADNSFTVTLSSNQFIKIGSLDRKRFIYTPANSSFVNTSCDSTRSIITVQTPSSISSISITIELGDTCSIDGGGGGGGGGGIGVGGYLGGIHSPGLPRFNISPPTLPSPLLQPPGGVPGVLTPPLLSPIPPTPTPPTSPATLPFIPPVLQPVVETIKEIIIPAPETTEAVREITQGIVDIISDFGVAPLVIEDLRANKAVITTIKNIIQPFIIAIGIFGIAVLTLTAIQASATFAIQFASLLQFFDLSRFLTLGLLQFKKRSPWGRILEKLTGKPVPGALVQVFDSEFKKLKDTQLTDQDGRFGSVLGKGKYFIKVTKDGFLDKETDTIIVENDNQVLNLEIIIAPVEQELSLAYLKRVNFLELLKRLLDTVSPTLLVIGTVLSLIALVIIPTMLNYIVFTIYILLDLLKVYFLVKFVKPFGKVLDMATALPISLAVIRIFELSKQVLLSTKATDQEGKFNFLIAPGEYYLTCVKAGYSPFRSNPIKYTKAALETTDVKLQKAQTPPATPIPPVSPPASPTMPSTPPPTQPTSPSNNS